MSIPALPNLGASRKSPSIAALPAVLTGEQPEPEVDARRGKKPADSYGPLAGDGLRQPVPVAHQPTDGLATPGGVAVPELGRVGGKATAADQRTADIVRGLSVSVGRNGGLTVGTTTLPFANASRRRGEPLELRAHADGHTLHIEARDRRGTRFDASIDLATLKVTVRRNGQDMGSTVANANPEHHWNQVQAGTGPLTRGVERPDYRPGDRPEVARIFGGIAHPDDLAKPSRFAETPFRLEGMPALTGPANGGDAQVLMNPAQVREAAGRLGGTANLERFVDGARNNELSHVMWGRMFERAWTASGRPASGPEYERQRTDAWMRGQWFNDFQLNLPGVRPGSVHNAHVNELVSDANSMATDPRREVNRILGNAYRGPLDGGYDLSHNLMYDAYIRAVQARDPGARTADLTRRLEAEKRRPDDARPIGDRLGLQPADYAFIQRYYESFARRALQHYSDELGRRFR